MGLPTSTEAPTSESIVPPEAVGVVPVAERPSIPAQSLPIGAVSAPQGDAVSTVRISSTPSVNQSTTLLELPVSPKAVNSGGAWILAFGEATKSLAA